MTTLDYDSWKTTAPESDDDLDDLKSNLEYLEAKKCDLGDKFDEEVEIQGGDENHPSCVLILDQYTSCREKVESIEDEISALTFNNFDETKDF